MSTEEQKPLLPTLFIRDKKGRARQWSVSAEEGAEVMVSHGLVGGKLTIQITQCEGKNPGKSNATTPEEQAVKEAQAKWTHQVDREDYHQHIDRSGLQFRPMLALDYRKDAHRVNWNDIIAQPKLDGLRLSFGPRSIERKEVDFMSRKGINYRVDHLYGGSFDLLDTVRSMVEAEVYGHVQLDGEIYRHGWSLQKIDSAAMKVQETASELVYCLFDLCIPNMPFEERYSILTEAMEQVAPEYPGLKLVQTVECDNPDSLKPVHARMVKVGFEGLMLRHKAGEYAVGQRSADLFKYKKFFDVECLVVDVREDKNDCAVLYCQFPHTGKMFWCTPKRTHAIRKEMMLNVMAIRGKWITVQFQALTDEGVPSFPVGLDFRDCNDFGEPLR